MKQSKMAYPGAVILFAISALICAFFVPIINSDVSGGLMPSALSINYGDVFTSLFNGTYSFVSFEVQFSLLASLFAVLLFVFSCIKIRWTCIWASVVGMISLAVPFTLMLAQKGSVVLGNFFSQTVFCLGFWLTLLFFLLSFIFSLIPRTANSENA